jgi:hypothetical protein
MFCMLDIISFLQKMRWFWMQNYILKGSVIHWKKNILVMINKGLC